METPNLKTIGIGTKETPRLSASPCVVSDTEIRTMGEGSKKANKVVFHVQHPKKEVGELIGISSTTVMRQKKSVREVVSLGTWVNTDTDGLLQKDSALATLLTHYGAANLTEMIGKTVQTEIGTDGYLSIKAY